MNTEKAILKNWSPWEKRNETQIRINAKESMKREIKSETLASALKKLIDSGDVRDLGTCEIKNHFAHWYERLPPTKQKLVAKPKRRDTIKSEPCNGC